MTTTESDKMIINITLVILRKEELITMEKIYNTVRKVMEMLSEMNQLSHIENVIEDRIIREIEALCDVYVPTVSTIDDRHDHQK